MNRPTACKLYVVCVCVGRGGGGGRGGCESLKSFLPHLLANDSRHVGRFWGLEAKKWPMQVLG